MKLLTKNETNNTNCKHCHEIQWNSPKYENDKEKRDEIVKKMKKLKLKA